MPPKDLKFIEEDFSLNNLISQEEDTTIENTSSTIDYEVEVLESRESIDKSPTV